MKSLKTAGLEVWGQGLCLIQKWDEWVRQKHIKALALNSAPITANSFQTASVSIAAHPMASLRRGRGQVGKPVMTPFICENLSMCYYLRALL